MIPAITPITSEHNNENKLMQEQLLIGVQIRNFQLWFTQLHLNGIIIEGMKQRTKVK